MTKVSLFAHQSDRENIIQKIHKLGIMQLIDLKGSDIDLAVAHPTDELEEIVDVLLRVSSIAHITKIPGRKQSFSEKLFGLETSSKHAVKRKTKKAILKEAVDFLKEHEADILKLEQEYLENKETLHTQEQTKTVLELFSEHDIPVESAYETEKTMITIGRAQKTTITTLGNELKEVLNGCGYGVNDGINSKEAIIKAVYLKEDQQKVMAALKKYGVAIITLPEVPAGKDPLAWINDAIKKTKKTIDTIVKKIDSFKIYDHAIFIREELELLKERFESIHKLKESKSFFILQGWVTDREKAKLKQHITEATITESEPTEEDNVPVKLSNPGWLKPFEMLTELYATPHYKDLDPTFIVGPLFLVYAGFMLTDFGYGLGLVILGGILLALFKKQDIGMTYTAINIGGIGIFAMLFGVLTGSYLGDAPQYFFGLKTADLAIWKDPLADPLYFLIISLFVGLVHLNIGLILGSIEDIRKKEWKTLVSERILWVLLQITVVAYVFKLGMAAHIIAGVTVLLALAMHGPLGLLGMTGFMGDVISYSRLFALALSTAGIAMTVNLLADMLAGVPYVGFFLAALIFIGGHLFSFAMNALGSFVHSIRLQFVEFFGKFYEGGGDRFSPFKEERVYTAVEEEEE